MRLALTRSWRRTLEQARYKQLVWCSYMMHTYDGFNAGDVPR